jgi:hypothetical protein
MAPAGRVKLLGLTIAMWLVAANIWTGGPVAALWVGSQAQGSGHPTMTSVFVTILILAAAEYALVFLLARLGAAHDRLSGHVPSVRAHVSWLRSMRGERSLYPGERPSLSSLERVLAATVVIVVVLFEIWFLFFSSSPIDGRTGRVDSGTGRVDSGVELTMRQATLYAAEEPQEGSSSAMRNDEPQPHEATTFGLFTSKPAPIMLSA